MLKANENVSTESEDDSFKKCTFDGCNALFLRRSRLLIHIRKHTGERPFVCLEDGCEKAYASLCHLKRHNVVVHKKEELVESIPCPFEGCDMILSGKWSLKKHCARKHDKSRVYTFTCPKCQEGFHRESQLLKHSSVHTNEFPFQCDQCPAESPSGYFTKRELNRHKRKHKIYNCKCGAVFTLWSLFLNHKQERSCAALMDEKPLICTICQKIISSKTNLKVHMVTHSSDKTKAFKCQYSGCDRAYFQNKNLQQHVRLSHTECVPLKIPCTFEGCDNIFTSKRNLTRHINKIHFEKNTFEKNAATEEVQKIKRKHKNYSCKCGIVFTFRTLLQKHKQEKMCTALEKKKATKIAPDLKIQNIKTEPPEICFVQVKIEQEKDLSEINS